MLSFDKAQFSDQLIVTFLDATTPRWYLWRDAYENSMTPLGYDVSCGLVLSSNGQGELHFKDCEGYTGAQVSHLIVRGQWQLRQSDETSFVIQVSQPEFDVVQAGGDLAYYRQLLQAANCWYFTEETARFSLCSDEGE